MKSGTILFLRDEKAPDGQKFFPVGTLPNSWEKKEISERDLRGARGKEKKINTISKIFNSVNTHFWAWSKFNIFANFDPLMANGGALKSS